MNRYSSIGINKYLKSRINWRLIASIAIVSFLVFARDVRGINIPEALFVVVTTLISLILPVKSLRSFTFFYLVGGAGIYGGALIPIIVALVIKSKRINRFQLVFTMILLLFEFVHCAIGSFRFDFINYFLHEMPIFLFFFLLFYDNYDKEDVYQDIMYYAIGVSVALLVVILHSINYYGINDVLLGNMRLGEGFDEDEVEGMATQFNSNYMAYYSLTAITLILFVNDSFKNNLLKYLLLTIVVLAGVTTSSRTWALLMVLTVVIHLLVSREKSRFRIVIVSFFVIILAFKFSDYSNAFLGRFESRFEEENVATAGSRAYLFKQYNDFLVTHPGRMVFGTGALHYRNVAGQPISAHNGTQQIVVCYGLIGLSLFIICGLIFYRRYCRGNSFVFSDYVPFLIAVLFLQSIQSIRPSVLLLPIAAVLLPLKVKQLIEYKS